MEFEQQESYWIPVAEVKEAVAEWVQRRYSVTLLPESMKSSNDGGIIVERYTKKQFDENGKVIPEREDDQDY